MDIRYFRNGKMLLKHESMLPLLVKMGEDARAAKIIGITYLCDPSLYISLEEDILITRVAETSVKNAHKPAPFHAHSLYRYVRALLDEIHVRLLEHDKEKFSTFALFFDEKIQ